MKPVELHQMMSQGCGSPGCDCAQMPLIIHSKCHIKSPTWTMYDAAMKTLIVVCAKCRSVVATIELEDAVNRDLQ